MTDIQMPSVVGSDKTQFIAGVETSPTMSSREIAELCEKEHRNVRRDIDKMLSDIGIHDALKFEHTYRDAQNRKQKEYRLPFDLTKTLLLGYDAKARYRVVKRMEELEGTLAACVPRTLTEALRFAADQVERAELAERTKSEIGSRREATAMNKASQESKKSKKLAILLDRSTEYATLKRVQMTHKGQDFSWRKLKALSETLGKPPQRVPDSNYVSVNAYHADIWQQAYGVEINTNAEGVQ